MASSINQEEQIDLIRRLTRKKTKISEFIRNNPGAPQIEIAQASVSREEVFQHHLQAQYLIVRKIPGHHLRLIRSMFGFSLP